MSIKKELLSTPEAAKFLGIHPQSLRRMVHDGKVPFVQFDTFFRFRVSDLEQWIESKTIRS